MEPLSANPGISSEAARDRDACRPVSVAESTICTLAQFFGWVMIIATLVMAMAYGE